MPLSRELYNQARSELGLTNAEVARRLGVNEITLYKWLSGAASPTLDHALALAKLLHLPLDDLASGV